MPRKSAAIALTREVDGEFQVFLALRNPKLKFFGGFYAFPGGAIDPAEVDDAGGGDSGFARCAVRELFEEIGVALPAAIQALPLEERSALRRRLLGNEEGAIVEWREKLGATDTGAERLTSILEITTPPFAPKRFETEFFHAELPAGEKPELWEEEFELVDGEFMSPSRALERWRAGEILIAPPVLLVLDTMVEHGASGFGAAARSEGEALHAGKLHPVRFSPGIFVAPLEVKTKPPATTTNAFLVGEERVVIIDPAPTDAAERQRLFDKIDHVREAGAELHSVLVTHAHPDHVGSVVATAERYGVPVGGHRDALTALALPESVERMKLTDGDAIDLGHAPDGADGWTLEVIETPGHSPDHLAFVESRYRSAVVGDLMSAVSTVLIDPPEGHLRTYLRTLEKLAARGVAMVYPGHGPAVRTGPAMIQHFIAHRLERVEQTHVALVDADEPMSAEALRKIVYHDVAPQLETLATRSLAASLEYLVEEERAVESDPERGLFRASDTPA